MSRASLWTDPVPCRPPLPSPRLRLSSRPRLTQRCRAPTHAGVSWAERVLSGRRDWSALAIDTTGNKIVAAAGASFLFRTSTWHLSLIHISQGIVR